MIEVSLIICIKHPRLLIQEPIGAVPLQDAQDV